MFEKDLANLLEAIALRYLSNQLICPARIALRANVNDVRLSHDHDPQGSYYTAGVQDAFLSQAHSNL